MTKTKEDNGRYSKLPKWLSLIPTRASPSLVLSVPQYLKASTASGVSFFCFSCCNLLWPQTVQREKKTWGTVPFVLFRFLPMFSNPLFLLSCLSFHLFFWFSFATIYLICLLTEYAAKWVYCCLWFEKMSVYSLFLIWKWVWDPFLPVSDWGLFVQLLFLCFGFCSLFICFWWFLIVSSLLLPICVVLYIPLWVEMWNE